MFKTYIYIPVSVFVYVGWNQSNIHKVQLQIHILTLFFSSVHTALAMRWNLSFWMLRIYYKFSQYKIKCRPTCNFDEQFQCIYSCCNNVLQCLFIQIKSLLHAYTHANHLQRMKYIPFSWVNTKSSMTFDSLDKYSQKYMIWTMFSVWNSIFWNILIVFGVRMCDEIFENLHYK